MAYVLPPLPYAFDHLEPYVDAQTMQIHHDAHHKVVCAGIVCACPSANGVNVLLAARRGGGEANAEWACARALHA